MNVFELIRKELESRFATGWTTRTPIKFENVAVARVKEWVTFTIRMADSHPASIGAPGTRRERHIGHVAVQIIVPKNSGNANSGKHADFAAAIFRGITFTADGIHYRFQTPQIGRGVEEGENFLRLLLVPFEADATY